MLTIRIPSKFPISSACGNRNIPRTEEDGSLYVFNATDEEYMFWNGLEISDREKFIDSNSDQCFFDALHKLMIKTRPNNYLESPDSYPELG